MPKILIALTLVAGMLSPVAGQEPSTQPYDPIDLVGLRLPWLLDKEQPGPYNRIIRRIVETFPSGAVLHVYPYRRALRKFLHGDAKCTAPATYDEFYFRSSGLTRADILVSDPINIVSVRAFTRPGDPVVRGAEDLNGRTAAVHMAVGGATRFKEVHSLYDMQAIDAHDIDQAYALLYQRRVDTILMMDYDYTLYAARHPALERLVFDESVSLEQSYDAIICKKSPATLDFIRHVNRALSDMTESGQMQAYLAPDAELALRQDSQ